MIKKEKPVAIIPSGAEQMLADVIEGLSAAPKRLPSRYIYDDRGSRLFEQIMDLDEYYLTNCESEILGEYASAISTQVGNEYFRIIELGAGNGLKTSLLIEQFLKDKKNFTYYPIDISEETIKGLERRMIKEYPELDFQGVATNYFSGIDWLRSGSSDMNLVLFLGSNIGNFNPPKRREFLTRLYASLNKGDLFLCGMDLKKDPAVLEPAYNDAKGVTSQFNFNLIQRINRELGGNFNRDKFSFYSSYNPLNGAIESFLLSVEKQSVRIEAADMSFDFDAWEPIHTESSYKYSVQEIGEMAQRHGFEQLAVYLDKREYFADALWRKK